LLLQVFIESFLRIFVATLLALAFTEIATPMVNDLTRHQIQLNQDFDWRIFLVLILINGVLNGIALVNLLLHRKKITSGFR